MQERAPVLSEAQPIPFRVFGSSSTQVLITCYAQLLAKLPVSSATNEWSFSTLKRIKTYLRNSLGEARLNGLAMLSIHCKFDVDVQAVTDDLAKLGNRHLQFVL